MAKGVGAILYIDVDSDSQYRNVGCIYNVKPPGWERAIVQGEACLADETAFDETNELRITPLEASLQSNPNATIQNELEAAIAADTAILFAIKIPLSTPVYMYCAGKVQKVDYDSITRGEEMKRNVAFVLTASPTYSTTASTLEA